MLLAGAPRAPAAAAEIGRTAVSGQSFLVVLECADAVACDDLKHGRMTSLVVRFIGADAKAEAPTFANVRLDASMPLHGHGMLLTPKVVPTGQAAVRADGIKLHMPGSWQIRVTGTAGKRQFQATFETQAEG